MEAILFRLQCILIYLIYHKTNIQLRDQSGYGLGQWEEALQSNASSHWLSPYLEWPVQLQNIDYNIQDTMVATMKHMFKDPQVNKDQHGF